MKDFSKADWVDPSLNWTPLPVSPLPERVIIDYATKCNLRCPMCPVWGSEEEGAIDAVTGIMPPAAVMKVLDQLAPARPMVQPSLYGEPLLIPDLRQRIRDMKERGMAVAMNTNGLTLTEDLANFFVESGVDSVFFSIDAVEPATYHEIRGVDQLPKVEAAVHRMLKVRGDRDTPRVGVSLTLQDANRDQEAAFVAKWSGVVDCVRVGLILEDGVIKGIDVPAERTPCPALYKTMPIHNDGTVTICCLDGFRTSVVGNVAETSVEEVWQGEEFAKVRYYHETGQYDKVPFCKDCQGWAQYDYQEEVRDGLLIRKSAEFTYYNRIDRLKNWQPQLRGGHELGLVGTEMAPKAEPAAV